MAGMTVAARFPAPLRDAAQTAVRSAFMTGLHRGSLVAAGATLAAALMALVFVPARAVTGSEPAIARTDAAGSGSPAVPPVGAER